MERKMYQMTAAQMKRFENKPTQAEVDIKVAEIRSGSRDADLKATWKERHRGKITGWGLGKAQLIIDLLQGTIEYQRGIWQGRVDKARGLEYSEERAEKSYNLGYYRGYFEYESNRHGWQPAQRAEFDALYLSDIEDGAR